MYYVLTEGDRYEVRREEEPYHVFATCESVWDAIECAKGFNVLDTFELVRYQVEQVKYVLGENSQTSWVTWIVVDAWRGGLNISSLSKCSDSWLEFPDKSVAQEFAYHRNNSQDDLLSTEPRLCVAGV